MWDRKQATTHPRGRCADGVGPRPAGWTAFYRLAAFLVLFCCAMAPAAPAQVALLVERGASTYQQAAQGFQQTFANTDRVEQIYIDESGRALETSLDRLRRNPPRLVVAIGTRAARTARERLPNIPIL